MKNKPSIKFKNRKTYTVNALYSASPEAEALFELLSPRKYLVPKDLIHIARMGFTWEIIGDVKEFNTEVKILNLNETE